MVCHTSALQIAQGDIVYLNETHDISLAVSYPTYQLAWCKASNFDCDPPDQIIDTENLSAPPWEIPGMGRNGTLERYWFNPDVFHTGTYHRWDGEWHPAEYSVAFTVLPGKRPKNVTTTVKNITEQPVVRQADGPYHYLIARGDTPTVYSRLQNQSESCHLWVFTNTFGTYNLPLSMENLTQSYQFNKSETYAINTGEYSGYIQCNGKNGWQDIIMEKDILDTPYDDRIVPDIWIPEWNALNAKRQFDDLAKSIPRFDDDLIPITVAVSDPTITITDVEQDENKLYIMGSTTWSNETPITLKLDPDNYALERDIKLHTWQTFTTGSIDAPRTFATALSFEKEELYVGLHEITAKVERNDNTAVSSFEFRVSDVYVMPTPTPETKRMIYGKDWEGIPVKVTPTPESEVTVTEEPTVEPELNITVNATPNATIVTTVPTPTKSNPVAEDTIPTIPVAPITAALAIVITVLRREI